MINRASLHIQVCLHLPNQLIQHVSNHFDISAMQGRQQELNKAKSHNSFNIKNKKQDTAPQNIIHNQQYTQILFSFLLSFFLLNMFLKTSWLWSLSGKFLPKFIFTVCVKSEKHSR